MGVAGIPCLIWADLVSLDLVSHQTTSNGRGEMQSVHLPLPGVAPATWGVRAGGADDSANFLRFVPLSLLCGGMDDFCKLPLLRSLPPVVCIKC